MRSAALQPLEHLDGGVGIALLLQMESSADQRRSQVRQRGLQRDSHRRGESPRRLHDEVDEIGATGQANLIALPVEFGDGLPDLVGRARAHAGAAVQDPVDGRLAQPGLLGDLADAVAVRHGRSLMGF